MEYGEIKILLFKAYSLHVKLMMIDGRKTVD